MYKDIDELNKKLKFAFSCIQNNNHLEAIKIYEEILTENQNNFDANSNLGMLYAQYNNLEKSEEYLNKAIEIDPKNPYALNNLASILIKLGKNEEAVKFSQIAINLKENFSLAYNNLGLAQQNIKKNDDAKVSFLKAIETEKTNVLPYYNLGFLYERLNDIKNSEIYYLKAIEVNPRFFNAYNNIMNLYERINDNNKLQLIIEKGEKEFSNSFSIKLFKGKLQFKNKLYNEAIKNLESFKFNKNNYLKESLRYSTLASSYDEINKFDKAFEYFELANSINFENNKNKLSKNRSIKLIDERIDFFNEINLKNWDSTDFESDLMSPIFIIGFPRSGTTLLNTILNSHPELGVIEEKPIVNKFIKLLDEEIYSNFSNEVW